MSRVFVEVRRVERWVSVVVVWERWVRNRGVGRGALDGGSIVVGFDCG